MASGGSDQNAENALSKLLQMGTVAEYESEFVILANRVTGISANLLKSFYISGLKLELQRELFRLMPTTLGEAFSLARIADTRFEDERSTIAIAKPNELTANVHVQDLEQTTRGRGDEPNRILLFSNLEELQENQEEHICYYYWENCFSILNTKEDGDTKLPLSADTFGNSGIDESESIGPETLAKEVVDKSNGSALIFWLDTVPKKNMGSRINISSRQHLESKVVVMEWGMIHHGSDLVLFIGVIFLSLLSYGARTRYSGVNLSLLLLYILTEQAHAKSDALY
ncbi:hypothetical protein Tco_0606044 [Tanacetum coccineum]